MAVNLQPIDRPMIASELRDRALARVNGESRALSKADQERRKRVVNALRGASKGQDG